ncbi:hypothetical protein F5X98DRAFT_377021 [Xylaria grammica]|nr:hypothetical protein F5X98DRAFT_377021 [Xylaria grammica]
MADPLSIAGLVTGVISLGLQVAGGLSDYLDAVKGRVEELNSAKQEATNMKDLILTIQDLLPQVKGSWPASATMIERHVKSCNTELSALYALLSDLSQSSPSGSGIRLKLADQKKRLTYPFNRSHISRLEDRLAKVNNALQTTLQVTGLNVSITSANQIRQVHDVVLSMSQLQVAQTQSSKVHLSLTATTESSERVASNVVGVPLDSIEAAMTLASKPSLLSTSISTLETLDTMTKPPRDVTRACLCRSYRKTSYHRSSWGYFSFSFEASNIRNHLPSCPFSQFDGEMRATNFSVEYSGLKRLVQKAFVLSFVNAYGAGGRSIGPSFTYYPTVNKYTAPAFRVMMLAHDMVYQYRPGLSHTEAVVKALHCCYDSIITLYSRKKASPKDISLGGQSLMHWAAYILIDLEYGDPVTDAVFSIVANLLTSGVPPATSNCRERTPSGYLLHRAGDNDVSREFANLLLPASPDVPLAQSPGIHVFRRTPGVRAFLQDVKLAEASGCGPLSLAARAGNEGLVRDLLRRHPESLKEVNQFGCTPLHLTVNHPPCLRLILEASGLSMLEAVDAWDCTPLACASLMGYRASVQILLAAGSRIYLWRLGNAHESCLEDLVIGLKKRRGELKLLALENLTREEAKSFGLHEDRVLDTHAFEVQELLEKRGVYIPPHLQVDRFFHIYSVYNLALSRGILDRLWDLGFYDVDISNPNGVPPLCGHNDFKVVRWLIEHGANYWTPLSERDAKSNITATPVHFVLAKIGEPRRRKVEAERWVVEKLSQVRAQDTCACPCFVGGCTPFKALFNYWRRSGRGTPPELARWYMESVQPFHDIFTEEDLIAGLRCMTFDALELTHTCCESYFDYYEPQPTPEEVADIHSEQSRVLGLFADLLIELESIAREDRGGVSLIVCDAEEFWMRRWLPRVVELLDSLDGDDLTEEEISAAEAVGVVWGPRPAKPEITVRDFDWYTPENVMKELEKIMNE